jgi:catechol 2,3-dioxygenase-like lactoylglutathione lyase family enzyme
MSAITNLYAGVPVADLNASIDCYTRLFGRPPDMRAGDEILWDFDEHATLFIEPNAAHAGSGRITRGVDHEPIETYSNGVRHTKVPDPDGNAIAFAEVPNAV